MSWWKFWEDEEEETPDYYAEGVALIRQGEYLESLNRFRLALREGADDEASIHAQMGVAYQKAKLFDEAVKKYREALELDGDHAGSHFGLGFVLQKQGRDEEAARHLEAFLAAPGDDVPDRQLEHARETLEELRGDREDREETDDV